MPFIPATMFAAKRNAALKSISLLLFICYSCTTVFGATRHFTAASGVWNAAGNWDAGGVPIAGDNIIIDPGKICTATTGTLTYGTLEVSANASLTVSTNIAFSTIVLDAAGTTTALTNTGTLTCTGITINGGATFTISNTVTCNGSLVVGDATSGKLTFGVTAKAISVTGDVTVSSAGSLIAGAAVNTLSVAGNFSNAGTFTPVGTAKTIVLVFNGSLASQTFSNTGTITSNQLSSLTINNTFAGSTVTIPNNLVMEDGATLTLTKGIVNTSLLTMGVTGSPATTLTGGSATCYINGAIARTFAARAQSGTYTNPTLFPVGKSGSYLPIYLAPTTTAAGLQLKAEAFTTNAGTNSAPSGTLSLNRWEASAVAGAANLTNLFMQQNDAAIASTNIILKASTAAGVYSSIVPVTSFASDNLSTATPMTAAEFAAGYFAYGDGCYTAAIPITGPLNTSVGGTITLSNTETGSWSSSNPSVATINTSTGLVTGVSTGTVAITFTVASADICNTIAITKNISVINGPGGVSANLQLWLKADEGTSTTVNGNAVSTWTDLSSSAFAFTPDYRNGPENPTYVSSGVNYNPAVLYAGGAYHVIPVGAGPAMLDATVFVVGKKGATAGDGYTAIWGSNGGTELWAPYLHTGAMGAYSLGSGEGYTGLQWNDNETSFIRNRITPAADFIFSKQGGPEQTAPNDFTTSDNASNNFFSIGNNIDANGAEPFGLLSETFIYNTSGLTATDVQKIESYLAFKYGITLDNSAGGTAGNYVFSNNSTAWTASTNPAYQNNIIGIVRDDNSGILQKQSHTADDSLRIFVGSIAADNASNTGSIANNLSSVMIGSDGGNAATSTLLPMPAGITSRFGKTWKITNTNFTGTFSIEIKWDSASMVDLTKFRLLVSGSISGFASAGVYGAAQSVVFSAGSIIISGLNSSIIPPGDNYITVGATTFTLLPVGVSSFDALLNGNKVNINWQTASEANTDYFTVEKSADAIAWAKLATLGAAGNPSSVKNYSTVDYFPYNGITYYRLKQTKMNGEFSYSGIRIVKTDKVKSSHVTIYPNPASGQLTIKGDAAELNTVLIYNLAGQDVTSFVKTISKNSTQMVVDIYRLSQGEYNIKTTNSITKLIKK